MWSASLSLFHCTGFGCSIFYIFSDTEYFSIYLFRPVPFMYRLLFSKRANNKKQSNTEPKMINAPLLHVKE